MVRVDHAFSTNHTVFVRWLQANQDTREGDPLNGRPIVFPGFPPLGEDLVSEVHRIHRNIASPPDSRFCTFHK